ncbi:ArdC-like ssDNA-binding domain-containing protein [Rhizobium lusitanum]|uniref:ArdC-like ssDNA-binding domain-containing protein n=1 Tax=Rhizobium lusitanum TaxID=293958 RepID=UPI0015723193|nr:ArdC-like ssDNA-binding domain-containing protein [Rhizobium lusitanum]NTJ11735.1 DUF1738 domain-containing protein [Rhizobium lusitanum]
MRQESRKSGQETRVDIYEKITGRIISSLEEGVRPWVQPWSAGHLEGRISRPLRHNGEPYSGINVLLLWSETVARGFRSPTWMTFRQAADLGIVPEMEPRPDHASYIASWLTVLKNEKRFVFSAAAHAQKAVAYLHDLQPVAQQRAA